MKKLYILMIMAMMQIILIGCLDEALELPEYQEIEKVEDAKFIKADPYEDFQRIEQSLETISNNDDPYERYASHWIAYEGMWLDIFASDIFNPYFVTADEVKDRMYMMALVSVAEDYEHFEEIIETEHGTLLKYSFIEFREINQGSYFMDIAININKSNESYNSDKHATVTFRSTNTIGLGFIGNERQELIDHLKKSALKRLNISAYEVVECEENPEIMRLKANLGDNYYILELNTMFYDFILIEIKYVSCIEEYLV